MSANAPPDNTHLGDGGTVEFPRVTLEALRAELRRRWLADDPIPAEVLFPPDADRGLKLQLLFTELVLREETRRPASVADFRTRLPDLAADIERQMNLLALMSGADLSAATLPSSPVSAPAEDTNPVSVPGYEIQKQLGRGGMGVVYLARQQRFNRLVALKVMVAGSQAGEEEVRRFRTEAEAIARLNHPGIVQVFDTGEWTPPGTDTPLPYFSMEYCPDGSLGARLRGEPQPPEAAARMARDLARAVHAAHEKGVVHRDLKPGNVLMVGTAVKITDFGLAKKLDADDSETRSGAVMGTPSYMPPEQAAGRTRELGPLVDVYALGAVLYEMLVGQPPFKGATMLETLEQVQHREPVPPRAMRPAVPRDLETISLKCLHKDPARRYPSAAALADDLERFLDGRPIKARPVAALERGWRWARRHRALAALYAVSTLAAVTLITGGFWVSARLGAADAEKATILARAALADEQKKLAEERARSQRFLGLVTRVRERSVRQRPGWTWTSLDDLREAAGLADGPERYPELRTVAATCLAAIDVRPRGDTILPDVQFISAAWSPDGRTVALGERPNLLALWGNIYLVDPTRPGEHRSLMFIPRVVTNRDGNLAPDRIDYLAFSPDGRRLAAGTRSGWLHQYDLSQPKPRAVSVRVGPRPISGVAFSGDGRRLFAVSDRQASAHDPVTLKEVAPRFETLENSPPVPEPGGSGLATGSGDNTRWLDDRLRPVAPNGGRQTVERWLSDGRVLTAAGGQVRVATRDGAIGFDLMAPGASSAHQARAMAYAPDKGHFLLTTSVHDRHARVWDPCDGQLKTHLVVPGGTCRAAVGPGGRGFVLLGEKGARLYEVRERGEARPVALQAGEVITFDLHDGGGMLATLAPGANPNLGVHGLFDLVGRGPPIMLPLPQHDPRSRNFHLRYHGPGHTLTRAGRTSNLPPYLWTERLEVLAPYARELKGDTIHGLITAGERSWAVVDNTLTGWGRDGTPELSWSHAFGEVLSGKAALYAVAAHGARVVVACRDGHLRVFHDGGKHLRLERTIKVAEEPLTCVALSADGHQAVAGTEGGEVVLFDLVAGTVEARERGHEDEVTGVAFLPDGPVVSGSTDTFIRVWQPEGGRLSELFGLRHGRAVRRLQVSPDGVTLYALLAEEHGVRRWQLDRLFERFRGLGLGDGLPALQARPLNPPPLAVQPLPATPSGPGLRAELYRWPMSLIPVTARVDQAIDFNTQAGALAPGMLQFPYSARWTGWLKPPKPGRYTFHLAGSTSMRLWLDGQKRVDMGPEGAAADFAFDADLGEGPHELRVEINVGVGFSAPRLMWMRGKKGKLHAIGPPHLFTDREAAMRAK